MLPDRMPPFILLRHCQKAGDALDQGLTPHGAACAERLADALMAEEIDGIWCSPYGRSQETIAPFARRSGLPVRVDGRLAEWRISATALMEFPRHAAPMLSDPGYRAPYSETIGEVWGRVRPLLDEIADSGAKRPVISAHGGIAGITLHSIGARFGPEDWRNLSQPSLIRIDGQTWDKVTIDGEVHDL